MNFRLLRWPLVLMCWLGSISLHSLGKDQATMEAIVDYVIKYANTPKVVNREKLELAFKQYSSVKELQSVFMILENRIGKAEVLKKLEKAPSTFLKLKPAVLTEVIKLYQKYLTPEEVNERLKASFIGFDKSNVEEIQAVIRIVRKYLSKSELRDRLKANLAGFTRIKATRFMDLLNFLNREKLLTREQVRQRMLVDLEGFSTKLKVFKTNIKLLRAAELETADIKLIILNNLASLGQNPQRLEKNLSTMSSLEIPQRREAIRKLMFTFERTDADSIKVVLDKPHADLSSLIRELHLLCSGKKVKTTPSK